MPLDPTFINPAEDCKIIMQQWAWFYAVYINASNHFDVVLCDVKNYSDVISAADSYESVKNVHFTDE